MSEKKSKPKKATIHEIGSDVSNFGFVDTLLIQTGSDLSVAGGLTKRELYAAMAMQGWIERGEKDNEILSIEDRAELAVRHADALIVELSKPKKEESK